MSFVNRRVNGSQIGKAGRASEQKLAKKLGTRLRPGSGAVAGCKGDVMLPKFLMEAKSTTGRSMALDHSWLAKITKEAREEHKDPALAISFTNGNGTPCPAGEWVMVPLRVWQELTDDRN